MKEVKNEIVIRNGELIDLITYKADFFELIKLSMTISFPNEKISQKIVETRLKKMENYLYSKKGHLLLAFSGEKFMGYLWYFFQNTHIIHINQLVVHTQYQKCGVGSQLLEKQIAIAELFGISELELSVSASNINAQCFYDKYGFNVKQLKLHKSI